jgi:hypothetical protein
MDNKSRRIDTYIDAMISQDCLECFTFGSALYRYTCHLIVIAASRPSNAAGTNRHVRHMATPPRSPATRPATAETDASRETFSPRDSHSTLKQT